MTPREELEALAGSTVYVNGAEYSADMIEPKTFAALRAVLEKCDELDFPGGEHPCSAQIRAAISSALEAS
jgi:hypothetical protein